jgi:hypothetical protein
VRWDVGCGGRLSGLARWLLELGEELGRSALGRAVSEMEDWKSLVGGVAWGWIKRRTLFDAVL